MPRRASPTPKYAMPRWAVWRPILAVSPPAAADEFNDSHFHLTNYVQEGADIHDFLKMMGTKVGRTAIFGIPLQQQWS